jgi:predicted ABC-type ATPase
MMLSNISLLLEENKTFSIETTLATRSYVNLILRAQSQGYKVNLLYFWLDSPDLAIKRVAQRVSEGGHNIPDETIRRRYHAGINNLFKLFIPIVDSWYVLDNSDSRDAKVVIVAKGEKNGKKEIKDISVYNKIKSYVR